MKKAKKIWLTVGLALILAGGLLFAGVMTALHWDFSKLTVDRYETNTYEIFEEFGGISMNTDTADISFAVAKDGKCRVECYERTKEKHSVTVQEGVLSIQWKDEREWTDFIGFHFESPKITLHLPQGAYDSLLIDEDTGDIDVPKDFLFRTVDIALNTGNVSFGASAQETIKIYGSTGDITVKDLSAGAMSLLVSTGKITVLDVACAGNLRVGVSTGDANLKSVTCGNFSSNGNTGDLSLKNVVASGIFSIERSTGNVDFNSCDAVDLYVTTDTGNVTGNLLSEKVFITETSTGRIDVPKSIHGGRCEITTSTGDICITTK